MTPTKPDLARHLRAVKAIMLKSGWITLREIERALMNRNIYIELQTVSARVRDLRKAKFGNHIVDRRYTGNGVYEYRIGKGAK